ncbi:helix-turn-helix domain-containing protein [Thermodesulfobacteriota bacterium]
MRTNLNKTQPRPLWKAEDVAQVFHISPKTVHRLVREGKLSCVQIAVRERRFAEELDHRPCLRRKIHVEGLG